MVRPMETKAKFISIMAVARGRVANLFLQNIDFELCNNKKDSQGRLLVTKIKIEQTVYVLCNVYAPTREHKSELNNFIKVVKDTLAPYVNENILLGEDFNFYMDLKLDKIESMSNKHDNIIYRKEIITMLDSMNLTDCFRDLFPTVRRYTWHSRGKSSRQDYWFISEHLLNELENYKILPGLHSDNSILNIKLGNITPKRSKCIWKFNNSLMHDSKYVNEIKKYY